MLTAAKKWHVLATQRTLHSLTAQEFIIKFGIANKTFINQHYWFPRNKVGKILSKNFKTPTSVLSFHSNFRSLHSTTRFNSNQKDDKSSTPDTKTDTAEQQKQETPSKPSQKPSNEFLGTMDDAAKDVNIGFESPTNTPDSDTNHQGGSNSAPMDHKMTKEDALKNKEIFLKVDVSDKKRMKTDFSKVYTENIFIPMSRAINEYLLESSELDSLPKYTRRSPYPQRDNITVFKRVDLEKRAIDKWGSLENLTLQKNFIKKRKDRATKQAFSLSQELYTYRRDHYLQANHTVDFEKPFIFKPVNLAKEQESDFFKVPSSKVVVSAVVCNALNCFMKFLAWCHTGSHSMFAEFIHSTADTINQVILAVGIRQSLKEADPNHPYGWAKFRNVSSLISGVGIFCVGAGLSFYHGITGLIDPGEPSSLYWALRILGGSFLLEGGTLLVALRELKIGATKSKMSLTEYITRSIDPTTNVVLMEDAAAVLGIIIAGTCISITQVTGHYMADAIGSLLIGTLLGSVASFIIYTNTAALVGKSIPAERRQAIVRELESDRMIRTLIDVKATEAGGKFVRFKAEVDFDGKEVTRYYLEDIDMEKLLQEIKAVKTLEEAESFMLKHGENIVDTLGGAVDRIEKNLKKKHPEIRHVDLEQL